MAATSRSALIVYDQAERRVVHVSDELERGFRRAVTGLAWFRRVAPADRARVRVFLRTGEASVQFTVLQNAQNGESAAKRTVRVQRFGLKNMRAAFVVEVVSAVRSQINGATMESLGMLAGGIAHDLNNVLMLLLGHLEQALRPPLLPSVRVSLEEMQQAGLRAASMIRELMRLSKNGHAPRAVDLNAVVEDTVRLLRPLIGRDIELVMFLGPDAQDVLAEPAHLQQLLLNLCLNARDAMPRGGRLTIRTRASEAGEMELQVEDNGVGMAAETRAHIFEPYFTTKGERGNGLGLATVANVVAESGGRVEVDSQPGVGTRFTVRLPAASLGSILVVEDDEMISRLVSMVLTKAGYEVRCVAEAESVPVDWRGDLLITDILLPGEDGFSLAQRMRRDVPGLAVLFITGYGDDTVTQMVSGLDPRELLCKPFTASQLRERVRVLGRRQRC